MVYNSIIQALTWSIGFVGLTMTGRKTTLCIIGLLLMGIMRLDAQNAPKKQLFSEFSRNNTAGRILFQKTVFFDRAFCTITNNYDRLFTISWLSLEQAHEKLYRTSLQFPLLYMEFGPNNTFKIVKRIFNNIIEEESGIYRFDAAHKLLYIRLHDTDYVFEIQLYQYAAKIRHFDFEWEHILELFIYENAQWDTPADEILKMEKKYYQKFGKSKNCNTP